MFRTRRQGHYVKCVEFSTKSTGSKENLVAHPQNCTDPGWWKKLGCVKFGTLQYLLQCSSPQPFRETNLYFWSCRVNRCVLHIVSLLLPCTSRSHLLLQFQEKKTIQLFASKRSSYSAFNPGSSTATPWLMYHKHTSCIENHHASILAHWYLHRRRIPLMFLLLG